MSLKFMMKKIVLFVLILLLPVQALAYTHYVATAITGSGSLANVWPRAALRAVGKVVEVGDTCAVLMNDDATFGTTVLFYVFRNSGATESIPTVVNSARYAGDGRWHLMTSGTVPCDPTNSDCGSWFPINASAATNPDTDGCFLYFFNSKLYYKCASGTAQEVDVVAP